MSSTVANLKRLFPEQSTNRRLQPRADRSPIPDGQGVGTRHKSEAQQGLLFGVTPPFQFITKTTRLETIVGDTCEIDVEITTSITFMDDNGVVFELPLE